MLDGIIHRNADELLILELELVTNQEPADLLNFYHSLQAAIERIKQSANANLEEIYQAIAGEVKKITEFDRVMVYKFQPDGSGEVVGEEKREDLEPYLGLHFPDADTKPCRYLYEENFLRLIVDVNAASVPLVPFNNPETQQPLDLTYSLIRDIAPCYREYLQNMGVQGTLVMSLMKKEQLWGMISCHHHSPKHLPYERVWSKTVENFIFSIVAAYSKAAQTCPALRRPSGTGSPKGGYPTIDFLHIQTQTTTFDHTPYEMRQACKFLGQVMSMELEAKEEQQDYDYQFELKSIETKLTEYISADRITVLASNQNLAIAFSSSFSASTPETNTQVPALV